MSKFDVSRIETSELGFNYVKVTPIENLDWGGMCICNNCNKLFPKEDMYLVFVLADTYCEKCFNQWLLRIKASLTKEEILEDLKLQKELSEKWYRYHLDEDFKNHINGKEVKSE